ncbi:hypothetical protein JNB_18328 [Janibacter sp. HTCC2649]|uniref:vWA domain-containing protein n=1 Tax=Janibacter sp. HTCC2649 TaxID=313589 RepID=UPI0000670F75|nr:VWA domain-containing protein [Janibacter sp. HTCC2649]EAP97454.1 hypothetical protein JNB_18328 [Janibacter sp. HTCC2649]
MTRTRITATVAAGIACVAMLFGTGGTAAATSSADEPVPGKLLLMLDASGSMKAKDPSGLTKIEAAKKALTGVVGALPDTAQVGLRVYGATVDGKGKPTPAACADTQLIHPIAALDKTKLTTTIAAIKALGETPIAHSLTEALKDLGTSGKRNIVLVSDGEESCVPDPCPIVKKLTAAGVDLQIDTVGFGVNAKARTQLQCIADAGKGTYYDAKDAGALATSLNKLSQRALRPFTVSGTPVKGIADEKGDAPVLTPGQYLDNFGDEARQTARSTGGFESRLYYRIKRTIPGSTPRVSVTARPPTQSKAVSAEGWSVNLTTEDGQACGSANEITRNENLKSQIVSVSAAAFTIDPRNGQTTDDTCASADTLVLNVGRTGDGGSAPAEIRYVEEPPVTDGASLPAAVTEFDLKAKSPRSGKETRVIGGTSFNDAEAITSGTYSTSIVPGEETFFKIPIEWGQSAVFAVDGPDRVWYDRGLQEMLHVYGHVRSPDRQPVDTWDGQDSMWISTGKVPADPMVNVIPAVAYGNRWAKEVSGFSLAGNYYLSVGITGEHGGVGLAGVSIPVTFSVAVNGTESGRPTYAGPSPDASGAASASPTSTDDTKATEATGAKATEDEGSGWVIWVGLGLVAVLGALGAAYVIIRTRLRGSRTE